MQRWKVRGEVLDSDDEDVGFSAESQSPEQPKKKQRLDDANEHDGRGEGDCKILGGKDVVAGDEDDWVPPQVVERYGRKVEAPRTNSTLDEATSQSFQLTDTQIYDTQSPAPSQSRSMEADHGNLDHLRSTPSEDLTDLEDLFGKSTTAVNKDFGDESPLSSLPPSPIVEVTISPAQSNRPQLSGKSNDGFNNDDFASALGLPVERHLVAQRTFRARKEKQLHPYMFDLAQYQKQFRERGLRPVRYVDTQQAGEDTQMSEPRGQAESSPSSGPALSTSSAGLSQSSLFSGFHNDERDSGLIDASQNSDDGLPGVHQLIERSRTGALQHPNQRRKLLNASKVLKSASPSASFPFTLENDETHPVPLSPPPTSTNSIALAENRPQAVRFRFPRGHTPKPLPTPDISSEARQMLGHDALVLSDDASPSRSSARRRPQRPHLQAQSSSESSEDERPKERVEARLKRERKRIRGVLPASWLKLDFQAQRRLSVSPVKETVQRSGSPSADFPQKGVARTVRRNPGLVSSTAMPISDDEDDTISRHSSTSPPRMRQSRLNFRRAQTSNTVADDFVDDERMEVDWIDPMFATSARNKRADTGVRRQPKIAEALDKGHRFKDVYSEERRSFNGLVGRSHESNRQRRPTKHHRLSILDAGCHEETHHRALPPFIQLAMRTARRRSDHGRHSPSQKQIRLGTKDDTEDATDTLLKWREGTIVPHQDDADNDTPVDAETMDLDETNFDADEAASRVPLAELPQNAQVSIPNRRGKIHTDRRAFQRLMGRGIRPKMHQTRLEPMSIDHRVLDNGPRVTPSATDRQPVSALRARQSADLPKIAQYRDAQVESLESAFNQDHRSAAFERRIQLLTESVTRGRKPLGASTYQVQCFLEDAKQTTTLAHDASRTHSNQEPEYLELSKATFSLSRRSKKQQARRIDAEAVHYRQPSEPLPELVSNDQSTSAMQARSTPGSILQSLGPFGTRYATDFDIIPLAIGTYFHESSFIGSGDFAASMDFTTRDVSVATGRISIRVETDILEWGPWTEDVVVGVSQISNAISELLRPLSNGTEGSDYTFDVSLAVANVDYLLRSVVRYISRCLVFLDPVDRPSCISHVLTFVEDILEAVRDSEHRQVEGLDDAMARCLQYAAVISKQAKMLCQHDSVNCEMKQRSADIVANATHRLARATFPGRIAKLRNFLVDNRSATHRESGIQDSDTTVCSVVILHHILQDPAAGAQAFWATVNQILSTEIGSLGNVAHLDNAWYSLFTILPFLEIDIQGNARAGGRLNANTDNWTFVRRLLDSVLELYPSSSLVCGSTVNDYFRTVLRRCFQLIARWGWWRCESVLGVFFDFFAKRGLAQLHKEDYHGSPKFLEALDDKPVLEVQLEDRSFVIFLKSLTSGLIGMREHHVYSDKKIGAIAWRFIPNHGRAYRKDAEVRQDDLDALRNHHDLLCALYYASPPAQRLRIHLLQQLVDHSTSHREACRLSVRAWSSLANFQVSTHEPIDKLQPFIQWFSDMLDTTLAQYRLARTEVEQEAASAQVQGALPVPKAVIEDTIIRNQRQIVATLVDLLAALKRALQASNRAEVAVHLVARTTFWRVFEIFNPSSRRLHGMLDESLEIFRTALTVQTEFDSAERSQSSDEDSQDYGDSSALMEFASTQAIPDNTDPKILDVLHSPLAQLISDILGADTSMEDALTIKSLDIWTATAEVMVRAGKRTLNNYIHDYTPEAWVQLRETDQKLKFTPYFLSRMIELAPLDIAETGILRSWLVSLVDREAMLKYQHRLTGALLERHGDSPLLHNLPFSRSAIGSFAITLHDFRQRRLSLLSSILSNMHQHLALAQLEQLETASSLKRTYAELLKRLMQAMKQNYQDLQVTAAGEAADVQVQGTYVEFVQHIVSIMQQYTAEICQIDRFFTDSSAFPLPAADPMYVVGRLRAYIPKLAESRKRKELSVLIQSVTERAAVDLQKTYLIGQMITAMTGVVEHGKLSRPSLRQILLTSVFPAYIETSLSTTCSWILARPILQACGPAAADLLYTTIFEDPDSVQSTSNMLQTLLQSMMKPLQFALARPEYLRKRNAQAILTTIFKAARKLLTCVRFVSTKFGQHGLLEGVADSFKSYAVAIETYLIDGDEFSLIVDSAAVPGPVNPWLDTMEFSRKQVHEKFKNDWHEADGQYYVRRGTTSIELTVLLGDEDDERTSLLQRVKDYQTSYTSVFGRRNDKGLADLLSDLTV